jgi:4'-phosphopantetheinyl transferase
MLQTYVLALPQRWAEVEGETGSAWGYPDCLTPAEQARAMTFRFESDQVQYALMHAALRQLLSKHLGIAPRDIAYSFGEQGKPYIADTPLFFNIAHTKGKGIIALSDQGDIGVDIEQSDRDCDHHLLARRVFTERERRDWEDKQHEVEKKHAFLTTWVAKEAYTKAVGLGLQMSFRSFDIADIPSLHWLEVGETYIAALSALAPTPKPTMACMLQEREES